MLVGLAIAATASVAQAAKPALTPQQKKAGAEAVAQHMKAVGHKQPMTMKEAANTQRTTSLGIVGVDVPTELWNTLSVTHDAKGNVRVVESDGTTPPATVEGLPNE